MVRASLRLWGKYRGRSSEPRRSRTVLSPDTPCGDSPRCTPESTYPKTPRSHHSCERKQRGYGPNAGESSPAYPLPRCMAPNGYRGMPLRDLAMERHSARRRADCGRRATRHHTRTDGTRHRAANLGRPGGRTSGRSDERDRTFRRRYRGSGRTPSRRAGAQPSHPGTQSGRRRRRVTMGDTHQTHRGARRLRSSTDSTRCT